MQQYLLSLNIADRIGFLKVENGDWPAIVFNEGDWSSFDTGSNLGYEKGIDIFPVLIDVVVQYEDYRKGYEIRNKIRKEIWKFNGSLTSDWEGNISFRQFLAPSYNHNTNQIVFGGIYLLKQNYDYEEPPEEVLADNETEDADNTD